MKQAGLGFAPRTERMGVLGGTFNPIHRGHLHIAGCIQKLFDLSQVLFVVSTTPPHKSTQRLVHFTHRYAMVGLATAGSSVLVPSMLELSPPASPFSIDTLAKLVRSRGTGAKIYFIAGADSMLEIASWHRSAQLLRDYEFIFASRPGIKLADPGSVLPPNVRARLLDLRGLGPRQTRRRIRAEAETVGDHIYLVDVDAPDISASDIRERIRAGKPLRHLVPGPVAEYMRKLKLYGDP
jgi:nicotinate-nucleotide adenylyltransferase